MSSPSSPLRVQRDFQTEYQGAAAQWAKVPPEVRAYYPMNTAGLPCRIPARRSSIGGDETAIWRARTMPTSPLPDAPLRHQKHLERIHHVQRRTALRSHTAKASATWDTSLPACVAQNPAQRPTLSRSYSARALATSHMPPPTYVPTGYAQKCTASGSHPLRALARPHSPSPPYVSPEHAQQRINAFGPASFSARLGAAWRLLFAHEAYAEALGAMWLHRLGSGMLIGSFMVLISGLGTSSPVQSVLTLAVVDLLSHIIPPIVSVHGAHVRDNADSLARVAARTTPSQYARGLVWTGVGDGLIAAAMFGLAWRVAFHGLAGPWLLVPLAILRLVQTCLGFYEFNLFNAFKARLPAPNVEIEGTNQHYTIISSGIRFVVLAVEANVGATLVSLATAAVVFVAESMNHSAKFHPAALTGIAVGGLIAALPKLVFYPHIHEEGMS